MSYQPTRDPALKDQFDEWLARIIRYAFSLPPLALVSEQNRATAETSARSTQAEGLEPAKRWAKELVDACVTRFWKWGDVEFVWRDEDPLGPLERARMDKIYLDAGVLTPDEVRARMGLAPLAAAAAAKEPVAKFNPFHRPPGPGGGQFTDAQGVGSGGNTLLVPVRFFGRTPKESFDPEHTAKGTIEETRQAIADTAKGHEGGRNWLYSQSSGGVPAKRHKCNLFVADVLREVGVPVPKIRDGWVAEFDPLAGDWSNRKVIIPGWRVLGSDEQPNPGDVIAESEDFADATGHMGIVVRQDDGRLGTSSASSRIGGVITVNDWGFREENRGRVVLRRFVGKGNPA